MAPAIPVLAARFIMAHESKIGFVNQAVAEGFGPDAVPPSDERPAGAIRHRAGGKSFSVTFSAASPLSTARRILVTSFIGW